MLVLIQIRLCTVYIYIEYEYQVYAGSLSELSGYDGQMRDAVKHFLLAVAQCGDYVGLHEHEGGCC